MAKCQHFSLFITTKASFYVRDWISETWPFYPKPHTSATTVTKIHAWPAYIWTPIPSRWKFEAINNNNGRVVYMLVDRFNHSDNFCKTPSAAWSYHRSCWWITESTRRWLLKLAGKMLKGRGGQDVFGIPGRFHRAQNPDDAFRLIVANCLIPRMLKKENLLLLLSFDPAHSYH